MKKILALVLVLSTCFLFASCMADSGKKQLALAANPIEVNHSDSQQDDYVEFLEDFQLKRRHIKCYTDKKNTTLFVEAEGSQKNVSPFEIYVLHIVQALWMADEELDWDKAKTNLDNEIAKGNAATRAGIKFTISGFSRRVWLWPPIMISTPHLGSRTFARSISASKPI